tara:strand:- start:23 stop:421 length:399 start_codon:yes stop_codon:yes gene_type:complete
MDIIDKLTMKNLLEKKNNNKPDLSQGAINRANKIKKLEAEAAKALKKLTVIDQNVTGEKKKKKKSKKNLKKNLNPKIKKIDPNIINPDSDLFGVNIKITTPPTSKKQYGGKVKYRSIGGKVGGNDVIKMIYD